MEGRGRLWVGDKQGEVKAGMVVLVPACHSHHLVNTGGEKMVLLVGIIPSRED
jgi:mannose-6-phosphate isomerase-like protein (cupin superfamily)